MLTETLKSWYAEGPCHKCAGEGCRDCWFSGLQAMCRTHADDASGGSRTFGYRHYADPPLADPTLSTLSDLIKQG